MEKREMLVWDVTCVCTLALRHAEASADDPEGGAKNTEKHKIRKYKAGLLNH